MSVNRFVVAFLVLVSSAALAQTTVSSGDWTDPSVWSGGSVPAAGGTVTVNHPVDILSNLAPTGTWTFNANATDQPGGAAYTFSPAAGTNAITINVGVTVTFTGGLCDFASGQIEIYGTLILGNTELSNSGNLDITVHPGGSLIIVGNLTNKNNSGTLEVAGSLMIYGNYDGQTGSTELTGSGTINATGSITTSGGSTVFGTGNDCGTGPCSGSTLVCNFANSISPTQATFCSGGSTTLTVSTAGGGTVSYQWESSTDNNNWVNAAGTSTNNTYNTGALTTSTWYRVRKTAGSTPCTSTSGVVLITVLTGGGWIGTSNDWGTASNWCSNSVPTTATDVTIANGPGIANLPVVNAGTGAVCNNLTLSSTFPATTLSIAASGTASLSIYGTFTNNGTFTDNSTAASAGVKFVGSVTQIIGGSNAGIYNNVTFANTSGGIIATSNLNVSSNLTWTSGLVNMNTFTLKLGTAAGSTGTLAHTAGHLYNGNFQRWYPTAAVALGNGSLFPVGSSQYYRKMYLVSSGVTTGGTIKVGHTAVADATNITPFVDNGGTVTRRSNSYWTVSTNTIAGGTNPFSMRTDADGMGTVADVNHLRITLVGSAAPGTDGAHAGTTTTPQVNRTGLTVANLANNFYWGSTNGAQTTLPVVLRWFNGRFANNEVELTWKTDSELDCDYFKVLHSPDGEAFEEIETISGLGTSATGKTYSLVHDRPARGINYYQLRQVDFDGTEHSFQVIRVEADRTAAFLNIYPNPVETSGKLNIAIDMPEASALVDIGIYDMGGRQLIHFTAEANDRGAASYEIDTMDLAPGMYIVRAGTAKKLFLVR